MAPAALARQLAIPGLDPSPSAGAAAPRDFVRGASVDRTGMARYLHIIRAAGDPERTPRPKGGRQDRAPHRTLAAASPVACEAEILELLADGEARTFNRIGVELLDHTADTLMGSPYDTALWTLVARDELEHTLDAPVLFRLPALATNGRAGG